MFHLTDLILKRLEERYQNIKKLKRLEFQSTSINEVIRYWLSIEM